MIPFRHSSIRFPLHILLVAFLIAITGGSRSLLAIDLAPTELEKRLQRAIEIGSPSAVAVTETRESGFGSFSGVIVSKEGHVLVAAHAAKPGSRYLIHLQDGRKFRAIGKGTNRKTDCALLLIVESGEWPYSEMGSSASLQVGQPLFCVSHPGFHRQDRGPVVRFGKVIKPLSERFGMIQSSVKMEPGDSGGPLFDLDGKVVGIRSQIQQSIQENFDIPIDSFKTYWEQLQEETEFKVDTIPGLPDLGLELRRSRRGATRVLSVVANSPADVAGLQENDLITGTEGSGRGYILDRIAARYLNGDCEIEVEVLRQEQPHTVRLILPPRVAPPESTSNAKEMQTIGDLTMDLQPLEAKLDDSTPVIRSKRFEESLEVLGVCVDAQGWIVTKSSCVGEGVEIRFQNSGWKSADVVARDPSNDLVLLRSSIPSPNPISLMTPPNKSELNVTKGSIGRLLISPRPDDFGVVSVCGSRTFSVPRGEGRGYLGVVLGMENEKVILKEINEGGAAKKAGLKPNDIVLTLDGRSIERVEDMHGYLKTTLPNDQVEIVIERDGANETISIKLGEVIKPQKHVADFFDGGKSNRRDGFSRVFVHDAPLYPHECGGPLFDLEGNWVGINIARISRTQSLGLPASIVQDFVKKSIPTTTN